MKNESNYFYNRTMLLVIFILYKRLQVALKHLYDPVLLKSFLLRVIIVDHLCVAGI